MKKMSTLYKKDPNDLGRVIDEVNPENEWALNFGRATVKWDGSACAIIDGVFYKRYEARKNKKTGKMRTPPDGAIPCSEPDPNTGKQVFWVPVKEEDSSDYWFVMAYRNFLAEHVPECERVPDGTYEACGPHFQSNRERLESDVLIPHGTHELEVKDRSFEGLKRFLQAWDIEGIVMCKIRKSDFGIKRQRWVKAVG